MRREQPFEDQRVKSKIFPITSFIGSFLAFGLFTTLQMKIIGDYIDFKALPVGQAMAVYFMWVAGAAAFTILTQCQIKRRYQKPIEEFASAAKLVAAGDFSVYLAPKHTADKMDYLDVLFTDFNTMVEELGSIETLKTDFFSNVSHEIKTPLAVIQNNAELLHKDELTEEKRKEYTENILHATKRLSNLITNMLKLNKLEKQTIKPIPAAYDVCAQICECALQFEDIWEKKEIEFEAEIEDRVLIEADEGLLEIVWSNLLSNAVKFTPSGGGIKLRQSSDSESITVAVSDTGCGMDEKAIKHIFDKFYQGDTSHSTEGNGLGLALVQRILQLSEGAITVKSEIGKGTTFTVRLPISLKREEVRNES